MNDRKKRGTVNVVLCYVCWGMLTVFWNLLWEVNSVYSGTACNLVHDLHGGLSDGAAAFR